MIIQSNPPIFSGQTNPLRTAGLRDSVATQDRLTQQQRIDAPEIQQSYRVSFSSAVLADPVGATRDAAQVPVDPQLQLEYQSPALRAYRQIAAL